MDRPRNTYMSICRSMETTEDEDEKHGREERIYHWGREKAIKPILSGFPHHRLYLTSTQLPNQLALSFFPFSLARALPFSLSSNRLPKLTHSLVSVESPSSTHWKNQLELRPRDFRRLLRLNCNSSTRRTLIPCLPTYILADLPSRLQVHTTHQREEKSIGSCQVLCYFSRRGLDSKRETAPNLDSLRNSHPVPFRVPSIFHLPTLSDPSRSRVAATTTKRKKIPERGTEPRRRRKHRRLQGGGTA